MGSKVTDVLTQANDIWGGPNKAAYDVYSQQNGTPNIGGSANSDSPSRAGILSGNTSGGEMAGASGAEGGGWGTAAAAALPVIAGIGSYFMNRNAAKQDTKNQRQSKDRAEDTDIRREATYRANRGRLQNAIADFYKQKGWAMPEAPEGAFTSRALPGEQPIYGNTTLPEANWYYGSDTGSKTSPPVGLSPVVDPGVGASIPVSTTPLSYSTPAPSPVGMQSGAQAGVNLLSPEDSESYKKLLRSYGY